MLTNWNYQIIKYQNQNQESQPILQEQISFQAQIEHPNDKTISLNQEIIKQENQLIVFSEELDILIKLEQQQCQNNLNQCFQIMGQSIPFVNEEKYQVKIECLSQLKNQIQSQIKIQELQIQSNIRSYIRPRYKKSIPFQLYGIFQLLNTKKQNEVQSFRCGCSRIQTTNSGLMFHLSKSHNRILPQNSSHVIVRAGTYENFPFILKLRIEAEFNDERSIWSCPCEPKFAMNVHMFVQHTIKIHQGISLFFKLMGKHR